MTTAPANQSGHIPSNIPPEKVILRIEELYRELDALKRQKARLAGLQPGLLNLLWFVCENPEKGVTVTRAAQHLGISPQALSKPINRLLDKGMIKRSVDEKDHRARRILPTPLGRKKAALAGELTQAAQMQIQSEIPAVNIAVLVLDRLISALKKAGKNFA
ncbi:MarR family winged helix-turn-helix transcriptional regulator [Dethiosulfatarculus sandiegensis]|uniref:HTH marR-type domain-containing protein n=1 Tax=Dethiosulfatarculus sandiegensis TaxID=1429043 RepID=A0A0D2J8Z6_9BACT|nr:MarR family transcriptional regulator [Dethiosulfatarculus sandiegensis]KIX14644.1 hypothetical protein X474_08110 [Dethiosulfatarculus sandiegensis]